MKKFVVLIGMVCLASALWAQSADVKKSDAIMEESVQNFAKAAELYESAAAAYEAVSVYDTLCIYRAGVCYMKLKDYSKSMTFFKKMESLSMNSSELYFSMSDNYAAQKDFVNAKAYLLKSIEAFPASKADATKKLVPVSYNGGNYPQAVEYANQALVDFPNDTGLMYIKLLALEQQNKLDEAIATGEALLAIDADNAKCTEKMGLMICRKVDAEYDKEKKRYEAMKTQDRVVYSNTVKKLDAISQGYRAAVPYLEKALAKSPSNAAVKSALDRANSRIK
jgi:tetratricopeptide (TPR) repeat protein